MDGRPIPPNVDPTDEIAVTGGEVIVAGTLVVDVVDQSICFVDPTNHPFLSAGDDDEDCDLEEEGGTPMRAGQRWHVGEHCLLSEPGTHPANDLVWRCEHCGFVSTGSGWFRRNDCDGGADT